jgi:2-polyprenyl-6-methoxyphenol hydroxylase-like FAD-dependent oxidoreductase
MVRAALLAQLGFQAFVVLPHRLHPRLVLFALAALFLDAFVVVGLLPPFLEAAEHVRRVRVYGPDLSELSGLDFEGIDCRCEFQCSLPQYETQRILEAHLASLGGAVERGVTATKVESDADDVQVELTRADGGIETVHPSVVIDAGGAHSLTRHSMSLPLEGSTYQGHFLVADIEMEAPVPRDQGSFFCSPDGMMRLAPLPGRALAHFPGP